jgi:two-component system, LytTR family, sensor kinase
MSSANSISTPSLNELSEELAICTFTNFERAKEILDILAAQLTPQFPFDIRLNYRRCAAFLENQWQNYDRALEHSDRAVAILESLADSPALAEMWADISGIRQNRREWNLAQECIDKARRFLPENPPPRLRAQIDCREGFLHLHLGNTTNALDSLLKAEEGLMNLSPDAPLKTYYMLALTLSGLGDLYERLSQREKSLDAYQRVLPIVEGLSLRPRLAWHYLNAGRAASTLDAKEGIVYFEKALEWAEGGDTEVRTHALGNLGILAILEGNIPRAQALMNQAAAQYSPPVKPIDFTNLSKIESWRAGISTQMGNYKEARELLEKAYEIGISGNDHHHLADLSRNLAEVNRDLDNFQKAYEWQCRSTEHQTENYRLLRNRDREDIEARHQLERSQQDARMARLRIASLQLRALRAQMNPHFMFNALNAIQGLITSGKNNEAESYLAKFARMMRHTLEYSDMEVVSLDQEMEFLERYLDINRKLRFRDRLQFNIICSPNIDTSDVYVPTMILQPFVENAIEHGLRPRQEGNLRISFQLLGDEENLLLCRIEDDGIGYNKGKEKHNEQAAFQNHRSKGMEITRERLALLHKLNESKVEEHITIIDLGEFSEGRQSGTLVEVLLPVVEPED